MDIRSLIRKIPDYPGPGTTYYDLTTLTADGAGFHALIDEFAARYAPRRIGKFVCMEWRGFVLGAGFVPIRRLGKVAECCFVHEIAALGGRKRLEKQGLSVFTLREN